MIRSQHEKEMIEKRLLLELKNVYRLYKMYNPNGTWLNLTVVFDESDKSRIFCVNNAYFAEDKNIPVHAYESNNGFRSLNINTKEDGENGSDAN